MRIATVQCQAALAVPSGRGPGKFAAERAGVFAVVEFAAAGFVLARQAYQGRQLHDLGVEDVDVVQQLLPLLDLVVQAWAYYRRAVHQLRH